MILTIIILSLISICLGYVVFNILRKYETIEEENEFLNDYVNTLRNHLTQVVSKMKDIDYRGSFEADDETGVIFKQLKDIVDDIEKNCDNSEDVNERSGDCYISRSSVVI